MSKQLGSQQRLAALFAIGALVTACGSGGADPSTDATTAPTVSAAVTAAATEAPAGTPTPTEVPGPPAARLLVAGAEPVDGSMGTFTWGEGGSTSPEFLPAAGPVLAPGTRMSVAFEPGLVPQAWTVRWLPVADGEPGREEVSLEQGVGMPEATVMAAPGPWCLAVTARFGPGREATWYWRITPGG
jgi:hypothetical protein